MSTKRQVLVWYLSSQAHDVVGIPHPCFTFSVVRLLTTIQHHSEEKNLKELKELGHFLKGSSATLGFVKVKDSCQVIQQYGSKLTLDGSPEPDEAVCLQKIEEALKAAEEDVKELQVSLKGFFGE